MRGLSASELLDVWEEGYALGPVGRSLALHARARPEASDDELRGATVGSRDADLISLRYATFGRHLVGVDSCPACGQVAELAFDARDVRVRSPATARVQAPPGDEPVTHSVSSDGFEIDFRLPVTEDLSALERADSGDDDEAERFLLERCVVGVRRDGRQVDSRELDPPARLAVAEAMARLDEQAEVQLEVTCHACGEPWSSSFDVASYLWREVDAWARRLAGEVHVLAWAYGWSESAILALSPWRRALYLEQVGR